MTDIAPKTLFTDETLMNWGAVTDDEPGEDVGEAVEADSKPPRAPDMSSNDTKAPVSPASKQPAAVANVISRMRWMPAGTLSTKPPPRLWLFRDTELDMNVIPLGEVGFVAGAGGVSKTFCVIAAAIAIALGKSWLETFDAVTPGRVALFLAEEGAEECHRRLDSVARALRLTEEEKRTVEARVLCVPLVGVTANLIKGDADTDVAKAMFLELEAMAAEGPPWRLIVFDALSRFAGDITETSNSAGANFIKVVEKFTSLPGTPTAAIVHHSNQASRTPGQAMTTSGIRGVTALTDNARWAVTLTADDGGMVEMRLSKSNYGPHFPHLPLLKLARRDEGVLSPASEAEIMASAAKASEKKANSAAAKGADEDLEWKLLAEVQRHPKRHNSANKLYGAVGGTKATVMAKVKALVECGQLVLGPDGFEPGEPVAVAA